MQWNTALYDRQHAFVSKYGEALVEILNPRPGEQILDLGCGTGDLANEITLLEGGVTGVDASREMLEEAKAKYPKVEFVCSDIRKLDLGKKFDAVFSNAVLHWIKEPGLVLERIAAHLNEGGRFVAELGAKGNVEKIRNTIHNVLDENGFKKQAAIRKWYFPSLAEYATLLEKHGFGIRFIETYERPTVLKDTRDGIVEWLEMFAGSFFEEINNEKKQGLLFEIQDRLYDVLFKNGKWIADYKRLRFCAFKDK